MAPLSCCKGALDRAASAAAALLAAQRAFIAATNCARRSGEIFSFLFGLGDVRFLLRVLARRLFFTDAGLLAGADLSLASNFASFLVPFASRSFSFRILFSKSLRVFIGEFPARG